MKKPLLCTHSYLLTFERQMMIILQHYILNISKLIYVYVCWLQLFVVQNSLSLHYHRQCSVGLKIATECISYICKWYNYSRTQMGYKHRYWGFHLWLQIYSITEFCQVIGRSYKLTRKVSHYQKSEKTCRDANLPTQSYKSICKHLRGNLIVRMSLSFVHNSTLPMQGCD